MSSPTVNECYSSSLKDRLKSSLRCFNAQQPHDILQGEDIIRKPQTQRSPCAWLRSAALDLEIRDVYRGLIGRKRRNRKRRNSGDFRYDPLSYQLNFEDESTRSDDELALNNFAARLPPTPDRFDEDDWTEQSPAMAAASREVVGWS